MKTNVDFIYPVGSVYMSFNSTDPGILFGGTWARIYDRFLYASGSNHNVYDYGGSESYYLTVNQIPSHDITVHFGSNTASGNYHIQAVNGPASSEQWAAGYARFTNDNQKPVTILPPYLCVNMWRRTA